MTRDEMLRLAREAGLVGFGDDSPYADKLSRFATLIAAAAADRARQDYEREHCRHVVPLPDALRAMIDDAVVAERGAGAADCDAAAARLQVCPSSPENRAARYALKHRAAAIRARGVSK